MVTLQSCVSSATDGSKNGSSAQQQTPPAGALGGSNDAQDLTVFVQTLLEQMQSRFAQMSDAIIGRIDDMGARIDELEKSISDLMEQTNEEGGDKAALEAAGSATAKDKSESV